MDLCSTWSKSPVKRTKSVTMTNIRTVFKSAIAIAIIAFISFLLGTKAYGVVPKGGLIEFTENLQITDSEAIERSIQVALTKVRDIRQQTFSDGRSDEESIKLEQKGAEEAVELLRNQLTLVFARPDFDGARNNLTLLLRNELRNYNAFEVTLAKIAAHAVTKIKLTDTPAAEKSTYLEVLENLMAETRPEIKTNPKVKAVFKKISQAQLELDQNLMTYRQIKSMRLSESPSQVAQTILESESQK